ncbi:unnamed protein product, partial [Acidithrix sp. C25]
VPPEVPTFAVVAAECIGSRRFDLELNEAFHLLEALHGQLPFRLLRPRIYL